MSQTGGFTLCLPFLFDLSRSDLLQFTVRAFQGIPDSKGACAVLSLPSLVGAEF